MVRAGLALNHEGMTLMMNDEGKYFYPCRSRVAADTAASTTITARQANDEETKQTPNAERRGLGLKFDVRRPVFDVRCFLPPRATMPTADDHEHEQNQEINLCIH